LRAELVFSRGSTRRRSHEVCSSGFALDALVTVVPTRSADNVPVTRGPGNIALSLVQRGGREVLVGIHPVTVAEYARLHRTPLKVDRARAWMPMSRVSFDEVRAWSRA